MVAPITFGGGITVEGGVSVGMRLETTTGAQSYSNGPAGYFFRVYGPLHPANKFSDIQPGWTCLQIPGSVVVSVVPDPLDNNESCTVTITGGDFVETVFYSFQGYV